MILSVCIFTYNHCDFISHAIESVLMQEVDFDFEILIGEDCSTDGTREIVEEFQRKYPKKIKALFNAKNLGMMGNNIRTISRSSGKYIALLDGDDYWSWPKKLQQQVNFLESNTNFSLCFHDSRIFTLEGKFDSNTCCGSGHKQIVTFNDIVCDVHIPTSSVMFRRALLHNYPPDWMYSINSSDRPLFLLLTAHGPGYYFNEPWGIYRQHPQGIWTRANYQSRWLTHLKIYDVVNKHFDYSFNKCFCKCQRQASYSFALELLKNNKVKGALCFFRNYLKTFNRFFPPLNEYLRILFFMFLYLKKITRH